MASNNITSASMYLQSFYEILVYGGDELRRINLLAGIMIGVSPIVHLLIVSGINVPYGRWTSSSWGVPVNVKVAWFLQVGYLYFCFHFFYFFVTCSIAILGH